MPYKTKTKTQNLLMEASNIANIVIIFTLWLITDVSNEKDIVSRTKTILVYILSAAFFFPENNFVKLGCFDQAWPGFLTYPVQFK
jgi:hypothetical protein